MSPGPSLAPPADPVDDSAARPPLTVDEHFAPVPEWVLDAEISDCALRLYAVLLRYGQTSGARVPSRATLARRLRKTSTDTVDRAMRELVTLGAVVVEHRRADGVNQTNRYHLQTRRPGSGCSTAAAPTGGSRTLVAAANRTDAATPAADSRQGHQDVPAAPLAAARVQEGGRTDAAPSPTGAAPVAAPVRPDPEPFTQTTPPPDPPAEAPADTIRLTAGDEPADDEITDRLAPLEADRATTLAARLGLTGLPELQLLVAECRHQREQLGLPVGRWTLRGTLAALHLALERGHPAPLALAALQTLTADPDTRSPMRLAETGPWWQQPRRTPLRRTRMEEAELAEHETYLADRDDRAWLQAQARAQLSAEQQPVDRLSVARRAHRLPTRTARQAG